jgi:pimeloyl-ACP methyl ester carboxylesterase
MALSPVADHIRHLTGRKEIRMLVQNPPGIIPGIEHHMVTGGGGARLHVVETGNSGGRPLVFLHGFSQSWLAWQRQMRSTLADDYRLVALDLRGHGRSDKPAAGYADTALWAEDVAAVLRELMLEQPVLIGWSYGTIVILDYLRVFGEDSVAGIGIVGGITKLGSAEALAAPRFQRLRPSAAGGAHHRRAAVGDPRGGRVAEGARAHGGARRRSRGARLAGPTRRLRSAPRIGLSTAGRGCVRRRRPGSGPRAGRANSCRHPRQPARAVARANVPGPRGP